MQEMVSDLRKRLNRRLESLPESRRSERFWEEFRHSPENVSARMVGLVMSQLQAPDRDVELVQLDANQQQALERNPVAQWVDWLDSVSEGG